MSFIHWSDEFSVGVKVIDEQHKKLVDMLNTLHDGMIQHKDALFTKKIILDMISYAKTHFATEEKYMVKFNYLGYVLHKKEHDNFAQKASELKERMERTGFVLNLEIIRFLRDWLQNHILHSDKKYTKCFMENGLK